MLICLKRLFRLLILESFCDIVKLCLDGVYAEMVLVFRCLLRFLKERKHMKMVTLG